MVTTFRHDVAANIKTNVLDVYQAANPTLLRAVYRARPSQIGETPCAWIGDRSEQLTHDSGTRGRTMLVQVVLCDTITDNGETLDRIDPLVDALLDALTALPHGVTSGTVLDPVGVDDADIPFGTVNYFGTVITVRVRILEGRD
jgi:hypothetical protein